MAEGKKSHLNDPSEWPLWLWICETVLSFLIAPITFFDDYDDTLSPGHKILIGNSILQAALIWHFIHYPATFQVPAEVGISIVVVAAYGLYDATLALYYAVPPWTVTTGLGLAGVVPLASGLWPVLREGE